SSKPLGNPVFYSSSETPVLGRQLCDPRGSTEVRSLWQGQNPGRKFKVRGSIFQGTCSIFLQDQKQIFSYRRRIRNRASDDAEWHEAHLSICDLNIVMVDRPSYDLLKGREYCSAILIPCEKKKWLRPRPVRLGNRLCPTATG